MAVSPAQRAAITAAPVMGSIAGGTWYGIAVMVLVVVIFLVGAFLSPPED